MFKRVSGFKVSRSVRELGAKIINLKVGEEFEVFGSNKSGSINFDLIIARISESHFALFGGFVQDVVSSARQVNSTYIVGREKFFSSLGHHFRLMSNPAHQFLKDVLLEKGR